MRSHLLPDGRTLVLRDAIPADAGALLDYLETVSGESDNLSFGSGEFGWTLSEEEEHLREVAGKDNQLYLLALVDGTIVSVITFSGGNRPRTRHCGEFGLTVRRECWHLGIGALMMDAMIDWARRGGVVTKINLRVRVDNERAIRLYRRKGFVHEGTITRESRIDGRYFDDHWMGLEL